MKFNKPRYIPKFCKRGGSSGGGGGGGGQSDLVSRIDKVLKAEGTGSAGLDSSLLGNGNQSTDYQLLVGGGVDRLEILGKEIQKFQSTKNKIWKAGTNAQIAYVEEGFIKFDGKNSSIGGEKIQEFASTARQASLFAYKNMMSNTAKDTWAARLHEDGLGKVTPMNKGNYPETKAIYTDLEKRAKRMTKEGKLINYNAPIPKSQTKASSLPPDFPNVDDLFG